MKNIVLLILCALTFFSCKEGKKEQIAHLVNKWQNKEIVFPSNMVFTRMGTDTVSYPISSSPYKILIYVDSLGCTSCKLKLDKWKDFIQYIDSVSEHNIPFLFVFHPKDVKELRFTLRSHQFETPVCFDYGDEMNKLNKFPDDVMFQTFLLNSNNQVEVIGNPMHNYSVKELYVQRITGKEQVKLPPSKAEVYVENTTIDMGSFSKDNTRNATFALKNIGEEPLVILDTNTSCGCVTARYDKYPANKGELLNIFIEVKPKEVGYFNETITVKCNTNNTIKLIIKGQAL